MLASETIEISVTSNPSGPWRMVFGAGSKEMMAVGAVGAGIELAAGLDKEAIVYQTDGRPASERSTTCVPSLSRGSRSR